MRDQQTKPPKSKTRKIVTIVLIAIAVILLAVLGRYLYVMFVNPLSAFDTPRPAATPTPNETVDFGTPAPQEPTPTPTLSPEEELQAMMDADFMKNRVNVLLLGWDQSPERENEDSELYRDEENNFRSDVLMLLTMDFENNTAHLISVPRDTYAKIYNTNGHWKINAAFAKGGSVKGEGFQYAMNTVSDLLGVPISYYVGVDMIGLKDVVDAMGGVDYDVDVEIHLNGRVLEKGMQHLDGQQVLDYCRARKGISTDVGRADRQQRMLFAIFEQLKSSNKLASIPKIYTAMKDKIHTNLNLEQIAALAVFGINLDMEHLQRSTLAGEYISGVYNASFYVLDNKKLVSLIKDEFGITIKPDPKYDIAYVKRLKSVTAALAYVDGASYLESVLSVSTMAGQFGFSGFDNLHLAVGKLKEVAVVEEEPPKELDKEALEKSAAQIDQAIAMAQQEMLYLCNQYGVTKQQVEKNKLPADFYQKLPSYVPTMEPEDNTGTDNPDIQTDPDAETTDPEAMEGTQIFWPAA